MVRGYRLAAVTHQKPSPIKKRGHAPLSGRRTAAMVDNDNACEPDKRGVLESIASKLAPTVSRDCVNNHKKGRCKRSGQGKTLDQELQLNVSEHGAMNRILNSSEIFHHGAGGYRVPAVVYRDSEVRISPWCRRKNTNNGHALLQPRQQSGFGCSSSGC